MRTESGELAEYLENFLNSNGKTVADMARATGLKKELVSMWKSRPTSSPRLDSLILVSQYTGLTVSQLIGQDDVQYSAELHSVMNKLKQLSDTSFKAVVAVIKTYYDMEHGEKTNINEVAG